MGQILHGSAKTTHAVRTAIQRSKASLKELAERYHLNPKTVRKWCKRAFVHDVQMGPKERRGRKPRNNRRVLNGIFYILRTGAPWRDLPECYGPYTTVYNRFNRWRKAGIWDRLMDAIVKAHDGKVQMIDSSMVRVHQHASGVKKEWRSLCGPKPRRPHHQDPRAGRCQRARSAS